LDETNDPVARPGRRRLSHLFMHVQIKLEGLEGVLQKAMPSTNKLKIWMQTISAARSLTQPYARIGAHVPACGSAVSGGCAR
jgi:hypothetical protein